MPVTADSFREVFAEFCDDAVYTDEAIDFWLVTVRGQMNAGRWGAQQDFGAMLFVAHRLVLSARAQAAAAFGLPPGGPTGPVTSKSVDGVSVSFDVSSTAEEDGGHWNLTTYGQQYLRLARQMGTGPVQVNTGTDSNYSVYGAWTGPVF